MDVRKNIKSIMVLSQHVKSDLIGKDALIAKLRKENKELRDAMMANSQRSFERIQELEKQIAFLGREGNRT